MPTRYKLDPGHSRFTVQAFASGLLSLFAHSPTFAVRDFAGVLSFDGDAIAGMRLEMIVKADALALVDNVKAADRAEIEGRMRNDVLATAAFSEIKIDAAVVANERVSPGHYRVRLGVTLSLHGATRAQHTDAELLIFDDGMRLRGESALRLSDFGIRPVTALGGAIKLKDGLKVSFDLAALPEGP
jgi:polyisoprenoid-binding protein YceI